MGVHSPKIFFQIFCTFGCVEITIKRIALSQNIRVTCKNYPILCFDLHDCLFLQSRFSKFKKYLLFFSPLLYHLALDLIMAPLVLYSIMFSYSLFFTLNSSVRASLSLFIQLSSFLSRAAITFSISASLVFIFFVFAFEYLIEVSLI